LSTFGLELFERFLVVDRKKIDIASYILEVDPFYSNESESITSEQSAVSFFNKLHHKSTPVCIRLLNLITEAKEEFEAKGSHDRSESLIELLNLVEQFDGNFSTKIRDSFVNNLNHLFVEKPLWDEKAFDTVSIDQYTRVLIYQNPEGPWLVELNRRLLQAAFDEIVQVEPELFPSYMDYYNSRMRNLIIKKAPIAKNLHRNKQLFGQNLASLFDTPRSLMLYLAASHWVNLQHPNSSKFFDLLDFQGPMYKIFDESEKEILEDWFEIAPEWIEGYDDMTFEAEVGIPKPRPDIISSPATPPVERSSIRFTSEDLQKRLFETDPIKCITEAPKIERAEKKKEITPTTINTQASTISLVRSLPNDSVYKKPTSAVFKNPSFAERRKTIGMGSVH
jgi:hypothetical protein